MKSQDICKSLAVGMIASLKTSLTAVMLADQGKITTEAAYRILYDEIDGGLSFICGTILQNENQFNKKAAEINSKTKGHLLDMDGDLSRESLVTMLRNVVDDAQRGLFDTTPDGMAN